MSRIGKKAIKIPEQVTVSLNGTQVMVKGPKGELSFDTHANITVNIEENNIFVKRGNDDRQTKAFHGLDRSLIRNMVVGVSEGYKKTLELVGTGYRVTKKAKGVSLAVGYSHAVEYEAPTSIQLDVEGNTIIHVSGIDKHKVGQVAAEIRAIRPPEAYRGKSVRYQGEVVKTKPGKTAKTA